LLPPLALRQSLEDPAAGLVGDNGKYRIELGGLRRASTLDGGDFIRRQQVCCLRNADGGTGCMASPMALLLKDPRISAARAHIVPETGSCLTTASETRIIAPLVQARILSHTYVAAGASYSIFQILFATAFERLQCPRESRIAA